MTLVKNTIAATFATLLIGGLAIGPASAAVTDHEKVSRSASKGKSSSCTVSKDETVSKEWIGDNILSQYLISGW